MASCPIPKSLAAATKLLEEYADLEGRVQALEEQRVAAIAAANTRADAARAPMAERQRVIAASLESWWPHAQPLIAGDRKSVELGGCVIGSRQSRPKLEHGFESDDKATEALLSTRWARQTTRIKYSLDRTATLKLLQLGGKGGEQLVSLGFSIAQEDRFFVERAG